MFSENLKQLRKVRVLTQEQLAIRLNVVRQTVSKWEKGLSVPDAEMLIKIAEIFEVSVSSLLGSKTESEVEVNVIAEQLATINEQLAIKNRRVHLIWKVIGSVIVFIVVFNIILIILGMTVFDNFKTNKKATSVTVKEVITQDK